MRTVYLQGPESSVYHLRRNCPAVLVPTRQRTVQVGVLHDDGAVTVPGHTYLGRRPCRRCQQ